MMFGRKKKSGASEPEAPAETTQGETSETEGETGQAAATGPRDSGAVDGLGDRVDLGSLQVTPVPGMELRLEVDAEENVSAAVVAIGDSLVQLQAFAAPRSSGIWQEIREEIEEMITGNGGTVDRTSGPFGSELHTRLPQAGPEGRTVFAPAVFAGVDGPRWLLRVVYSGPAALDPAVREPLDEAVRGIVVHRGDDPRAPRELLPLAVPRQARTAPGQGAEPDEQPEAEQDDLRPFERGPEITEVR